MLSRAYGGRGTLSLHTYVKAVDAGVEVVHTLGSGGGEGGNIVAE